MKIVKRLPSRIEIRGTFSFIFSCTHPNIYIYILFFFFFFFVLSNMTRLSAGLISIMIYKSCRKRALAYQCIGWTFRGDELRHGHSWKEVLNIVFISNYFDKLVRIIDTNIAKQGKWLGEKVHFGAIFTYRFIYGKI